MAAEHPADIPSTDARTDVRSEDEPVTTGTLFLMIVFLMMIFGFWILMYRLLIGR